MPILPLCLLLLLAALLTPTSALAYLGPVLGLGVIGSLIAVVVVGLLSVFSFVYLPIRNFLRRKRRDDEDDPEQSE